MKVAPKTYTSGILNGYLLIILISHIIHGIGIFTHMNGLFLMVNVGKYTVRPMGWFLEFLVSVQICKTDADAITIDSMVLHFRLQTMGQLATPQIWNQIAKLKNKHTPWKLLVGRWIFLLKGSLFRLHLLVWGWGITSFFSFIQMNAIEASLNDDWQWEKDGWDSYQNPYIFGLPPAQ